MCPSQQQLSDYILGKLNEVDSDSITDHLKVCEDCRSRIDSVDESVDSMVQKLRHPTPDDEFMKERQCQLAIADSRRFAREHEADLGFLRDYQLIEKLGEGGMGTVYSAVHTKLEKSVAIKLLPADRMRSADAISRFEREMKAIGKLQHPNIVQAHDAGEAEGKHYLVMELLQGFNASILVKRLGPLPVPEACEIIRQASIGLQHAHENELVHRDIKPSNIMVTPSGDVKILDLGLARQGEALPEGGELTSTGQIMGTLDYMAPEQLGDSHTVDCRADIYSLGATLYKLLTGSAPYADKKFNTPQKKLMAIATKPAAVVGNYRDDVPPKVVDVLDRMMAKNLDDRFVAVAEVSLALNEPCAEANLAALVAEAKAKADDTETSEGALGSTVDPVASSFTDTQRVHAKPELQKSNGGASSRRSWPVAAAVSLFFFAAVLSVFYLFTGKATLIIDVESDDVEVKLKEHGVVVHDLKNDRKWTIRQPGETKFVAGDYRLSVTDDTGLMIDTKEFSLARGGKKLVSVRLQPPPPKTPPFAVAPFDVATAQRHQSAWADYLHLPVEWTNSLGMQFALIPPGEFLMGSSDEEQARFLEQAKAVDDKEAVEWIPHEGPQHRVKITQPFYLGQYEVTQAKWEAVMGSNPSEFKDPARPVECVSWTDAQEFLRKLDQEYSTRGVKFVLPTEAQWEYAARAGSTTAYCYGDSGAKVREFAWIKSTESHPTGQLKPNPWGIYDMYGNVWEWCWDLYEADYYTRSPINDPRGRIFGGIRVRRGGGWAATPVKCRSANRGHAHMLLTEVRTYGIPHLCASCWRPGPEISAGTNLPGWRESTHSSTLTDKCRNGHCELVGP